MNKRVRQYVGLLSAVIAYYLLHEGAHLLYALSIGAFKQINLMGLGMQIDIYAEKMTQTQLGVFCMLGSVTTLLTAYILISLIDKIRDISSKAIIALDGVQPYLKTAYLAVVSGMTVMGILTLTLQNCQAIAWAKSKTTISLTLGALLVLLFMISSQPYAAVFAFVLLTIKALILIKRG